MGFVARGSVRRSLTVSSPVSFFPLLLPSPLSPSLYRSLHISPAAPTFPHHIPTSPGLASLLLSPRLRLGLPRCGFSQKIIGILEDQKVEYTTFDILGDESVRQSEFGVLSVLVRVAERWLGGLEGEGWAGRGRRREEQEE